MSARLLRSSTALLGTLVFLSNPALSLAEDAWRLDEGQRQNDLERRDEHHRLSHGEKVELLRHNVKYVFVIFHENESFDHYFGTFPGANGLFSAPQGVLPANKTPSFTQR